MSTWTDFKEFMFSGKALSASPEVVEALAERRANFLVRLGGTNQRIQYLYDTAVDASYSWYYENSPAVRTVVDLLASNVAQLDLRLYDEIDVDEREEKSDHPAMEALRHPNNKMASDQFIRYMVKAFCLYDNAYALMVREQDGGPLQFVTLPPERVKIQGRGLQPEFYVITLMHGAESEPIRYDEMFHWRGENFQDMRVGTSRLSTLRAVIAEEAAMSAAIVELAKSGLAEPQWVYRPLDAPEWSNEARDRFEEDMGNRLRKSTSRPPVAEEGMELRGFGVSPKDAEMLSVRKYALQQVATLFGVPLGMVGLADNIEEAQAEFYSDTLPPLCEALTRQLNLQVLQGQFQENDLYFEFNLDEKMMGNERLKALTGAAGVPPLLRDEARAMLNLKKVPGGQEPLTPANMVSGADPKKLVPGDPTASKPSNNVMPIPRPDTPAQDGSSREGDAPSAASVADALLKFYSRFASAKKDNPERWGRELAQDLAKAGLNGDANVLAVQIVENLAKALQNGDRAAVINNAKAEAPRLAARWEMAPEEMKALGLPEEVVWERMGYSQDEINRMRSLRLAESLAGEG